MAHWEQVELVRRVRRAYPQRFRRVRVLEVGSGEIRGGVRALFEECDYLGVDVAPGSGVDRVCPGQDLDEPSGHFDVVVSCECFEHNPFWRETFINMLRMLRPGGLCIVTSAMIGRQEHGTDRMNPHATLAEGQEYVDYYCNLFPKDLVRLVDPDRHFAAWVNHPNIYRKDLYFVALKHGAEAADLARFPALAERVRELRLEKTPGVARTLYHLWDYALKRTLVAALGERRFHDAKFAARGGVRRLLETIVGRERVARFRTERRRQKDLRKAKAAPPGIEDHSQPPDTDV